MPINLDFEDPFAKPKEGGAGIQLDFEDPFAPKKKSAADVYSEILNPAPATPDPGLKAREMLNKSESGGGITGAISDLGRGLYTGVTRRVPELIGQAMEFSGIAPETGKALADWGREGEVEKEKGLFEQTGEMIPSSSGIPLALGTAGKLISMIPHPYAQLAGKGLQLASYLQPLIFGLSQAQQTKEAGEEKVKSLQEQIGKTTDETEKSALQSQLDQVQRNKGWAPYATGTIETAGETLANVALQRLLGPLAGTLKNAGTSTLKDFARPTAKEFLKRLAVETIPTETSTEFGQQWGEALVEKKAGIRPEANPLQEGIDVLAPTALMTILTGAPAHVAQRYGVNRMLNNFSKPVEGYSPYEQNLPPEIARQVQDRKAMADIMAKMIESDDTPEVKALSEQWKDYAYGQIALNQPIEVNKPIHDLIFQEPAATPVATPTAEIPGQARPEDYVTPVDTEGVKMPGIIPPVERGPESEIRGIPDLLFEWTKKKPSRILDQQKYSPEKMAEQFNISTDLAKKALEETKVKLIAEVERKIGNLEKHPDVVNRGQRGPEEKASRPVNNYVKLLNQYSQLTGRPYDRTMQGGLHGEVGKRQEPGGGVSEPGSSGKAVGAGGILQTPKGQKEGLKGGTGETGMGGVTTPEANLIANAAPGKEGVTRLTYLKDGHIVGNARLLGGTIGDIQVNKKFRRQGIGLAMVKDLVERGGRSANAVTPESRGLFAKAGFTNDHHDHFTLNAVAPTPQEIDQAAYGAATSPQNNLPQPTPAQKEAGNYQKGHVNIQGLDISIENPKGSQRTGVSRSGVKWSTTMQQHYGYIKGTVGKDKDHIDTFIGEYPESNQVFVVNQVDPESGKFDEHKIMMGFSSQEEAQGAYLSNYQKGWKGLGTMVPMTMDEFKSWLKEGDTKKEVQSSKFKVQKEEEIKTEKQAKPAETKAPEEKKGRDLFTQEQLAEFDLLKIDVTGVTAQYKDEALQQIEFAKKDEGLTDEEYNAKVKAEYERQEQARKEKTKWALTPTEKTKSQEAPGSTISPQPKVKPTPKMALGSETTVSTARTQKIPLQYAVADIKDLITSHDNGLNINPDYPQELQPRNRTRLASEEQIGRIINKMDPDLLGENPLAQYGAPIVTDAGVVLSGNARTIALKRIWDDEKLAEQANAYRDWLKDQINHLHKFGLYGIDFSKFDSPVLVRVNRSDMDQVKLAQEANEEAIATMSPSETAINDAEKMGTALMDSFAPSDEGNILAGTNREFIRLFMRDVVSPNEANALTTRDGELSQAGINRIRNAVFAKTYGDTETLERLAESTDNNVRNITNGMLTASAGLMKVKAGIEDGRLYPLDISRDIVMAMQKLSDIRNEGITYEYYLKNPTMFDTMTPESKVILGIFNQYSRSAKKIGEWLGLYAETVQGSPKADENQGNLFDDQGHKTEPTKAEVIEAALKKMEARHGPEKESSQLDILPPESPGGGQATNEKPAEVQKQAETPEIKGEETAPLSEAGNRPASEIQGMTDADINSVLDDVFGKEEPTAKELVKKAGVESLTAIKEGMKGLATLFTPKNTLGTGPVFNEDTYAQAKPHFEAMLKAAIDAGHTVADLVKHIYNEFGDQIRPYLKRFLADQAEAPKFPPPKEEDPYRAAIGVIGAAADRIKDSKYEFAYGPTKDKSDIYWDMVGIFSGGRADRLLAEGITLKLKADFTGPDLTVSNQERPLPGHPEAIYFVQSRKPDLIPDTFKVIITRRTPFFSIDRTGMTGREAYAKVLSEYEAKLKKEAAPPSATVQKSYYFVNEKGKYELHFDKAEFDALPAGIKKDIKGYFIWVPSRKAWQSKGKAEPGKVIFKRIFQISGIKERAITAPETTGTETQKSTAIPSSAVADWVQARLDAGEDITKQDLFAQSDSAFNGKQSEGKYTPKDAFDALEMGINRFISDSVRTMAAMNPNLDWEYAKKQVDLIRTHIMDRIPSQAGTRTAEMDEFQQFSTPPDLAYVMAWAAHLSIKKDVVLEPSAGVGGIATFAKKIGVKTIVNEFSPRRAALLNEMGFDRVFTENAEQLNNILPADVKPTVVLMNPPFSSTAGRVPGERSSMNVIKHLDQAFKRLEDGGRMVALIGKGWFPDSRALTDYLSNIVDNYNLHANIIVSGKNYAKYGTTYDNRILVIDKTAPDGKPTVEGQVEDVKNAIPLLQEVRDERTYTEPGQTESNLPGIPAQGETKPGPQSPVLPSTHGVGAGPGGGQGGGHPVIQRPGGPAQPGSGQGLPPHVLGGGRGGISNRPGPGTEGSVSGRPGLETVGQPGLETQHASAGLSPSESTGLELERIKEEEHPTDITDSLYEDYAPKKAVVKGSQPHPGPIIESAAMASVDAPDATYQPHLPQDVIDKGLLSNVQLEPIIYAGQAHQEVMPNGQRKGFFIGDGTGVGKGREIAGILLDNWNQGRKKAVWISQNAPLIEDAQRDVKGIGWNPDHIFDFGRIKLRAPVNNPTGIAFLGYDVLRSKKDGATRLDQLVNWFGKNYDGVIVFDESHNMGNAIAVKGKRGNTKPSEKALAGLRLQAELPNARVVYVSATGATEVMNFAYAGRLGLWGEGTAFADAGDFITKVGAGGLAAMELVARDLKALGKYSARSLSYDNVKYDRLIHPLTDTQREIYDELAGAWQITLQNIDAALEETGVTGENHSGKLVTLNSDAKTAAKQKYWGSHQRFFNQIITSMQMPTVVKAIEQDLKDGKAIVLQLVNTNESATNRALSRMEDPEEIEDLDLTPREHLMEYIKRGFPVNQYERYVEVINGSPVEKSRLVVDSAGNPVLNVEAVAMRDALLDRLGSIRVPDNPIDTIINHFGVKNVAEVTGRTKRVIEVDDEKGHHRVVDKRSKAKAMSDADAFMNNQKQILIFSYAGGTGRSYHADLSTTNQKIRSHYLIQPGWRADRAVQGLGRTHRTNQAQPPEYHLVTTDLNGQKRFISSIARRLDQLGALTRGQRQTGGQGLFAERDNLESKYAGDALASLIEDIANGRTEMGLGEFAQQLGLNIIDDQGNLKVSALPDVPQFLNRLLSMQVEPQNRLFDMFSDRLDLGIAAAIRSGTMDVGLETIRAKKIEKISEQTVYTEPRSGAKTKFVELELTKDAALIPWDQSDRMAKGGYAQNIKSGRVWALSDAQLTTDHSTGIVSYSYKATGVNFGIHSISRDVLDDEEKYKKLTRAQAEKIWNQEYDDHPKEIKERNYLISGILLPIYNRLPEGNARIIRIQTASGEKILGRLIPPTQVQIIKDRLGAETTAIQMTPREIMEGVIQRNLTVELANGWKIVRKKVSGDDRIEIKNADWRQVEMMKDWGAFTERINYETRLFIPTTEHGETIIQRMMQNNPILATSARQSTEDILATRVDEIALHYEKDLGIKGHDLENAIAAVRSIKDQLSFDFDLSGKAEGHNLPGRSGEVSGPTLGRSERVSVRSAGSQPYKTVGHAFAEQLIRHGSANYTGQIIEKPSDLALLAQVFRNPKFETFRIFYVKNNTIVGHEGITSKVPGYVSLVPGGDDAYFKKRLIPELKAKIKRLGADGFWLVHNHPSGSVKPSSEDVALHQRMDTELDYKMKGGIIINGNKYGLLERKERVIGLERRAYIDHSEFPLGRKKTDKLLTPSIDHPILGAKLNNPRFVAELAGKMKAAKDLVTLLYLGAQNDVRAIQEVPVGLFKNYKGMVDYFRGRLREYGSTNAIPVFPEEMEIPGDVQKNIKDGILQGHVLDSIQIGRSLTAREFDSELSNATTEGFFAKEPVKSFRVAEGGEQFSAGNGPVFYSKMGRFLEAKLPNTGIPLQWKSMIENWAKKGEFKDAELKWSGLGDWLVQQKGRISKEDVVNFLKANQVEIKEVTRGGAKYEWRVETVPGDEEDTWDIQRRRKDGGQWETISENFDDPEEAAREMAQMAKEDEGDIYTKFHPWQIPGGQNYRELLLTLPEKIDELDWKKEFLKLNLEQGGGRGRAVADTKRWTATINGADYQITYNPHNQKFILDGENGGLMNAHFDTLEEAKIYALKGTDYKHSGRNVFRSSHWFDSNVMAHVRFNDRTDTQGHKVLFLEEIQSDWALEGRKRGFVAEGPLTPEEIKEKAELIQLGPRRTPKQNERLRYFNNRALATTPAFPFAKNWHELVLKRMLRYAAENGFDRLAWIGGQETANRYDLSKRVDSIRVQRTAQPSGAVYKIIAMKDGYSMIDRGGLSEKELAEDIGKDLAEKAINDKKGNILFKGPDLKIGGAWAYNLYDRMIPQFLNKYAKQWGAKVEETNLKVPTKELEPVGEWMAMKMGNKPFQSIPITPSMKESVLGQGQPLFNAQGPQRAAGLVSLEDIRKAFKGQEVTQTDEGYRIKTNGDRFIEIKQVDQISDNQIAFETSYGRQRAGDEVIAGSYKNGRIKLVQGVANNWVLSHESVHLMEDYGIITPGEAALLENHIKGLVKQGKFQTANKAKIGGSEDRANFIADQLTNPDPEAKGFIKKIVARIQDFVDRLVNAFGGRTVQGITRDIGTGKIFNREGFGDYGPVAQGEQATFAGMGAFKAQSAMAHIADAMERDGLTPAEIWKSTGWIKGIDKLWRFELDDSQAKVATRAELYKISWGTAEDMKHGNVVGAFLKDVLTYPDLFENYPQISGVWVRLIPNTNQGSLGKGEITKTPTISVGYDSKTGIINKSVLFHEIQHFIQEQEGFAMGGNVDQMKNEISLSAKKDMAKITAIVEKAEAIRLSDEFKQADQDYIDADLTDEALKIRNDSAPFKAYFGEWNKLEKFAQKYGSPGNPLPMGWFNDLAKDPLTAKDFDRFLAMHRDAFELYRKLAGEAEAREVQNRLGWTSERRAENPPTWDGIPEKDLILRTRQGGMSEFAVLKSRTDLDQAKVDAEISNFEKSSFADSMATIKDMAKNWGKAELPGRPDTSLIGRFFGSPEFTFEKVPALKKVVTFNLERADLRVGKFNDLISDPAGRDLHEGMRVLQKERPEEYKRLGDLLVKADQDKRVHNAEAIRRMGFSDQAVSAWADARAIMDNGFDRQIASYQEMVRRNAEAGLPAPTIVVLDEKGHPKEVSVKTAIALMGEMRGWYWPRLRESGAYQIVAKATPEMKAQGLHNRLEFKDFFVEHRAAELRRQGYQVEYFKSKSIPEDLFAIYGKVMGTEQMINEALNRSLQAVGNKSNFQFSDMGIKAMWSTSTDEKPDFMLDTKKVPQERLAKIMPVIRAMGGRWYAAQKGEPKFWHFVDKGKNIETRLRRSLSRYDNRLLAVEEEFARALTVNVANIEKGRGFRSSMIQRGPEVGLDVWEGYEQDPLKAMTSYVSRLAAGEAKKETALKMIRAFNGTEKSWAQFKTENEEAEYEDYMKYVESQKVSPTEQKNAYHDGLTYIQEALRNPEMADRVVGVAKGLANFKYLGFRVAAPLVNMTALITSVPAAMQGYAGISLLSTFKWLGKGADLWRQYRHPETWSTLPAETQAAFHIIQHKGWADSQYNREAMEVLKSKAGRGWTRVMDWSMWMFATTEQLNRVATMMGTFAAIREREGGLQKTGALSEKELAAVEQAMETAKRVSDRAHGVYGPATIPAIAQGKGPAGMVVKSLYMFKKFQHNYLQTLYELGWKQSNWKAATYMMAAPTLLAGAGAFPIPWAWDAMMGILKHLFGWDDPEEKFFSSMEQGLGDYVGGIPRQGIAGVGGHLFDFRASLGTGKLDMPTNMIELLGAPGSVLNDVYRGGANILNGNAWKGVEKILPRAAGTVLQGYREATEGVTTKTNAPVFFGREPMKENFLDAALKSLSFNPARIQRMKDIERSERGVWQDYRDRRGEIESGFLKFYLQPADDRHKASIVDLIDSVSDYNNRVRSHGLAGVEPMITSESLKMYISRNLKPSKKELIKNKNRQEGPNRPDRPNRLT